MSCAVLPLLCSLRLCRLCCSLGSCVTVFIFVICLGLLTGSSRFGCTLFLFACSLVDLLYLPHSSQTGALLDFQ